MNLTSSTRVNQTFSGKRFWLYSKAVLAEKLRSFVWFFGIIGMIYCLILMISFSESSYYNFEEQAIFYYLGLFTTGFVFSARYFANFAKKESALVALMQPASVLEKWLLAVIVTLIIYPIVYTILYTLLTLPVVTLIDTRTPWSETNADRSRFFLPFRLQSSSYYFSQLPLWLFYQTMCAFTIMTSLYFKSLPLLKTCLLAFCVWLLFIFLGVNIEPELEILFYYFDKDSAFISPLILLANLLFWVLTPLLLWLASYRALLERELL